MIFGSFSFNMLIFMLRIAFLDLKNEKEREIRERKSEIKRQKERKTEGQGDRETERRRDIKTERKRAQGKRELYSDQTFSN